MYCQHRTSIGLIALAAGTLLVSACDDAKFQDQQHDHEDAPQVTEDEPVELPDVTPQPAAYTGLVTCPPAVASDHIPARADVMVRSSGSVAAAVSVDDLFEQFKAHCVGCHVDADLGGFKVSRLNFTSTDKRPQLLKSLMRVRSDDPAQIMPPPPVGKPFSSRPEGDPVREFANLLDQWVKAGAPSDVFYPAGKQEQTSTLYFLPKQVGENMTNLGNCIPDKRGFAAEKEKSAELDHMFEQATTLPNRLDQTDLISWDSQELARYGVVAYAPTYTLWADNAKKVRMIRVPRGQSIKFDKDKQSFTIPPNTRFYKTFLKKVTDRQGNTLRWRKMETRLIVSRPDDPGKEGLERHTALFGTYAWNDAETEAVLVRDPLRNGKPFRDRLVTYYTNEQRVEELVRTGDPKFKQIVDTEHLSRHYAIPGSERCVHCHMGSPSESFVLGFSPLQVHRRPMGEGGVIEPAERDELSQLQRLIDYGLITGISSPDEVTLLEDSQGTRKPRNDHELDAQGYMMGNCAHCHNPRGFPTYTAPDLRDLLDFLPSDHGGIFQFPLDRHSPRNFRGFDQATPQPYITPSLFDLPQGNMEQLSKSGASLTSSKIEFCKKTPESYPAVFVKMSGSQVFEVVEPKDHGDKLNSYGAMLAPWRSLIYRNVEAPFSYSDDFAIYPHMPRDTPGYDCRAKQILGTWMVSIPAKVKEPELDPYALTDPTPSPDDPLYPVFKTWASLVSFKYGHFLRPGLSNLTQPYQAIESDAPDAITYQIVGEERVELFQKYGDYKRNCVDPEDDIVDPLILSGDLGHRLPPLRQPAEFTSNSCQALSPTTETGAYGKIYSFDWEQSQVSQNLAGVSFARPHWFVTDLTDAATSTWSPRRSDWHDVLVDLKVPRARDQDTPFLAEQTRRKQERHVIHQLTGIDPWRDTWREDLDTGKAEAPLPIRGDVRLTPALREYALSDLMMGLWQEKPACAFAGVKQISDVPRAERPAWMSTAGWAISDSEPPKSIPAPESAHLYSIKPGAQVFVSICGNCHGPLADSRGRMADTIADLTGGDTRVANLRDGLFGAQSTNWKAAFDGTKDPGGSQTPPTAEDWAARYVLWMGMGGTLRTIPQPALNVVGTTRVMGIGRRGLRDLGDTGANMLGLAQFICSRMLTLTSSGPGYFDVGRGRPDRGDLYPNPSWDFAHPAEPLLPVLASNGDFDMWQRLCTLDNTSPIVLRINYQEVFLFDVKANSKISKGFHFTIGNQLARESYGDALVGDHRGKVQHGISPDNYTPWCVVLTKPEDRARLEADFAAARTAAGVPAEIPYCPDSAKEMGLTAEASTAFARRGAMNAGLAAFTYLNALAKGEVERPVSYDRCEELK
jgi:mono/diheme cytochrome c family protein